MPFNHDPQGNGPKNHYEVLGLSPEASDDDIRKAYKYWAFTFHPDRQPATGLGILRTQYFLRVRESYEALRTPERRAKYDLMLGLNETKADNDNNVWHKIAGLFRA